MTTELALCLLLMAVALPVSWSIGLHYAVFALVNVMLWGVTSADSSFLAMLFAFLAVVDILIGVYSERAVLYFSAAVSIALSFESMLNADWLLNHSSYLSIAVNAALVACLAREYRAWMHGRSRR